MHGVCVGSKPTESGAEMAERWVILSRTPVPSVNSSIHLYMQCIKNAWEEGTRNNKFLQSPAPRPQIQLSLSNMVSNGGWVQHTVILAGTSTVSCELVLVFGRVAGERTKQHEQGVTPCPGQKQPMCRKVFSFTLNEIHCRRLEEDGMHTSGNCLIKLLCVYTNHTVEAVHVHLTLCIPGGRYVKLELQGKASELCGTGDWEALEVVWACAAQTGSKRERQRERRLCEQ
ncbi:hypothetical protein DFH08DRAFT_815877 [Mycena albidolilacea]|uniref:Uncharacterized protein n=1 Tax=Mycena albidolilacea TaxID=1033008 RepID=A0AAD6ZLI6_9AGAR|nr:hypothetical protein DFH08DRAFT_815877 [Mycena albidolilacea]